MNISESPINTNPPLGTKALPFTAKILSRRLLNTQNSTKKTYHIELCIKDSGIIYRPGDSVAIFAENDALLVEHLLNIMNLTGKEKIQDPKSGNSLTSLEFLTFKANLSRLTTTFLNHVHAATPDTADKKLLGNLLQQEYKKELQAYMQEHEPCEVLNKYRPSLDPILLPKIFSPLLPRFYSISSSQKQTPEQIDLTVALYTFTKAGEQRFGLASHFLCHAAKMQTSCIPIYIQQPTHFRLPADASTPIIMIGPGTGIAPFRAFLQERIVANASGKNWLFFGERQRENDFYYKDFFENLIEKDQLKLSTAFSRDQEHKIYVQDVMKSEAKMLWSWLKEGSYLYVCGDAEKMAKEVDAALHEIAEKEGALSKEEAKEYFKAMRKEKRYLCDVY